MVDRIVQLGRASSSASSGDRPRVLISGAARGVGLRCAQALAERGAELLLSDRDPDALEAAAERLGQGTPLLCDVSSETSVARLADAVERLGSLDMLINAAGGGYSRTLGMYRMSRALIPALRRSTHQLIVNVPPSPRDAGVPAFPYASSRLAFHRLSAALAHETRGTPIAVWIACPAKNRLMPVIPDPNAGTWVDSSDLRRPTGTELARLAGQVAALLEHRPAAHRHAS